MNTKQLALLVAAGVVLGGAGLYVRNRQSADYRQSATEMGGPLLRGLDASAVAALRLASGTNRLNLARSGDDWVVAERGGFPANFGTIRDFVRKLVDLRVTRPVEVGPSRLPALDLVAPDTGTGTLVELLGADGKPIRSLLLGKKYSKEAKDDSGMGGGWPIGRYVMVDGKVETVALVNEVLSNAEPRPEDWLDKEWFKVEQPVSVTITHPEATNSFALSRTNEFAEWTLATAAVGEKLDPAKVSAFGTLLGSPSFDDVVVDPKSDALGLDAPVTAVIATSGGWKYEVRLGKPQEGDKYPVRFTVDATLETKRTPGKDEKKEDAEKLDKEFAEKLKTRQAKLTNEQARAKWTYLASKWTIDAVLKKRSELLAEAKQEEPKTAAEPPAISSPALPGN